MPNLTEALLARVGAPWTLRIWALGTSVLAGVAVLFVNPRVPTVASSVAQQTPRVRFNMSGLRTTAFAGFFLSTLIQGIGYLSVDPHRAASVELNLLISCFLLASNVGLYLPSFSASLGYGKYGAALLSIFNVSCIAAQILTGWASDRFSPVVTMATSASLGGIASLLLWGFSGAGGLGLMIAFVLVFGVLAGGYSSVWARCATSIVGDDKEQLAIIFAGKSSSLPEARRAVSRTQLTLARLDDFLSIQVFPSLEVSAVSLVQP